MSSATVGLLVVAVIGYFVDKPLFSSALLVAFVYAMMILMSEHAQNSYRTSAGLLSGKITAVYYPMEQLQSPHQHLLLYLFQRRFQQIRGPPGLLEN